MLKLETKLILVAVQSKAFVCSCLIAAIVGLIRTEGMNVCLLCLLCCVGSSLCSGLITHSEESYLVCVS
jgi:hypothetical protein